MSSVNRTNSTTSSETVSSSRKGKKHDTQRTFQVIKWIFVFLTVFLIAWSIKLLTLDRESIEANEADPIMEAVEERVIRGSILDSEGRVLAITEVGEEDGNESRRYPYGESMAHVVGYTGRGDSGLEASLNRELLTSSDLVHQIEGWVNNEKTRGNSVQITIDAELQKFIYEQMEGYRGAVVVREASTGALKALVSSPSFDPEAVVDDWELIAEREDSPLYNRATQGLYPPGSTFKILTALAMIRHLPDFEDYDYTCEGAFTVDDTDLYCAGGNVHGFLDFQDAFAYSCNGFFAGAGVLMGKDAFVETAAYAELLKPFDLPLPESESTLGLDQYEGDGMIAQTAIGQGKVTLSPLALNQLTALVACGGYRIEPYLVDSVLAPDGSVVSHQDVQAMDEKHAVLTPEEAAFLEELMEGVITYGTGSSLYSEEMQIYGKTGTAQVEGEEDHSWFTGYVKVDGECDLVITVLIENGGYDKRAVPLAAAILDYVYD